MVLVIKRSQLDLDIVSFIKGQIRSRYGVIHKKVTIRSRYGVIHKKVMTFMNDKSYLDLVLFIKRSQL